MRAQLLNLRIDWSETDQLGHVNNVAVVKYCQAARIQYLTAVGLPVFPGMTTGPIEAAATVQFSRQLFFPGNIAVYTRLKEVKNTSLILEHRIFDDRGTLAVGAEEVIVYFDFKAQTKIPLTDSLREQIAAYEQSFTDIVPAT